MDRGAWWAAVPRVGHEGSDLPRTPTCLAHSKYSVNIAKFY